MTDPRTLITEEQLRRMLVGPTSGANAAELARKVYAQESVYTPLAESSRDPTCAERIAEYMGGRSATIAALQNADRDCEFTYSGPDDGGALQYWSCATHTDGMGLGDVDAAPAFPCDKWHTDEDGNALGDGSEYSARESADERLAEMPLSVELVRHVKVLLGTGGPADWLDAELDADNEIRTLTYGFADWFDSAELPVERDTPLWRFAESFVDVAAYADTPNVY